MASDYTTLAHALQITPLFWWWDLFALCSGRWLLAKERIAKGFLFISISFPMSFSPPCFDSESRTVLSLLLQGSGLSTNFSQSICHYQRLVLKQQYFDIELWVRTFRNYQIKIDCNLSPDQKTWLICLCQRLLLAFQHGRNKTLQRIDNYRKEITIVWPVLFLV